MNLKKCGFGKNDITLVQKLNTPEKIQSYIDNFIIYDPDREDRSVLDVVRDKKAECFNGALFAAACLLYHGYKASVVEILANKDEEHVLTVYKSGKTYGAVAQSKFMGLRGRNPFYLNLRDLVASYIEFYIAFDGRYSMRSFTKMLGLSKYKYGFLNNPRTVEKIAKDIRSSKHYEIISFQITYFAHPARFWREVDVVPPKTIIPKKYLLQKGKFRGEFKV